MAILAFPSIQETCLVLAEYFWEGLGVSLLLKSTGWLWVMVPLASR